MSRIKNITHTLAVGSCKGGVGKTTFVVNLAMALRRTGAEVGIFDADLYGPNIPLMLGLRTRESRFPFSMQMKKTGKSISYIPMYNQSHEPYITPKKKFGLYVMSLGLWFNEKYAVTESSFLGSRLVTQVLSAVKWPVLDYLIIDLPPGTDQLLKTIVERTGVNGMILVTTPQDMTLLDSGRSLELFRNLGIKVLGRVENMSYLDCPGCGKRIEVYSSGYDDWQVLNDLDLLGEVPLNQVYARPIDAYHPFTQLEIRSEATAPFLDIADKVKGLLKTEGI